MIQRVQSFYLVLSLVCMILCFMFPIATFSASNIETGNQINAELNFFPKDYIYGEGNTADEIPSFIGQESNGPSTLPLVGLAALIGIISLVSIFLYKNRPNQVKVASFAFLFNAIYVILVFFLYIAKYKDNYTAIAQAALFTSPESFKFAQQLSVGFWAPLVSIILLILAIQAIKKDEAKVRAADRLR